MSNLIKAEFFKLRKKHFLVVIISVLLLCIPFSFIADLFEITKESVSASVSTGIVLGIIILMLPIIDGYTNRMAMYEIMDGKSPLQIIGSKYVVYLPFLMIFYFIPMSAILLMSDKESNTMLYVLLLFVITLRLFVFSVSCVQIAKSAIGVVFLFGRMVFEMIPVAVFGNVNGAADIPHFFDIFSFCQVMKIGSDLSGGMIACVLISAVIEMAIMLTLAYMSYSRKWNVRTSLF